MHLIHSLPSPYSFPEHWNSLPEAFYSYALSFHFQVHYQSSGSFLRLLHQSEIHSTPQVQTDYGVESNLYFDHTCLFLNLSTQRLPSAKYLKITFLTNNIMTSRIRIASAS